MKIINNKGISISAICNFKSEEGQTKAVNEIKQADKSSLEALSSIGKAQVNMTFKGGFGMYFSKMNNAEYLQYKKTITQKLRNQKKLNLPSSLIFATDKSNIILLDRIISKEFLYPDIIDESSLVKILNSSTSDEKQDLKINIFDKIFENLYDNDDTINNLSNILIATNTEEDFNIKSKVIDEIWENEQIYENDNIMNNIGSIISSSNSQANLEFLNIIFFDEKCSKNEENMKKTIKLLQTVQNKAQLSVGTKILSNDKLYDDNDYFNNAIGIIYSTKNSLQSEFAERILSDANLYENENVIKNASGIISSVNTDIQKTMLNETLSNKKFLDNLNIMNNLGNMINSVNNEFQSEVFRKIISNDNISKNENFMKLAADIINGIETDEALQVRLNIVNKIDSDEKLYTNEIVMQNAGNIIKNINSENQMKFVDKLFSDERLYNNENVMKNLGEIIEYIDSEESIQMADKLLSDERLYNNENIMSGAKYILEKTDYEKPIQMIDKILSDERLYNNKNMMDYADLIISMSDEIRLGVIDKLLSDELEDTNESFMEYAGSILSASDEVVELADKIISNEKIYKNEIFMEQAGNILDELCEEECAGLGESEESKPKLAIVKKILSDEKLYTNENIMENIISIIDADYREYLEIRLESINEFIEMMDSDESLSTNENVMKRIGDLIISTNTEEQSSILLEILSNKELYSNENVMEKAEKIIERSYEEKTVKARKYIIDHILSDKNLYNNERVKENLGEIILKTETLEEADRLIPLLRDNEISLQQVFIIMDTKNEISQEQIHQLNKMFGINNASKLTIDDMKIIPKFLNLYNKENINEILMQEKREIIRNIVSSNEKLFKISDKMKQMFPLIPTNEEEYCSLLPSIVRSLGIETNPLDNGQIQEFNKDINNLGNSLSKLSDEEFNNLEITQKYTKDEFIKDVLDKVQDLNTSERQKVYDYFGFELHKNRHANTQVNINGKQRGFSIVGYPVNLNNGKKLAQITDPNTREVVEILRDDVIKFSENNKIICNNPVIEEELNNIVSVLPEIRTEIDNIQAGMNGTKGSHEFDIMKHSLKVMQKIVQNSEYKRLNNSDKKIMLIASLLHDITKKEGYTDETHSDYGAFDTFFISKKFNLTQDEEIKLYNLVKHHEWLGYVNRAKSEEDLTKRLQNTAYDLRHDNMLEMSLIFTHADLKAVKSDDSFHDRTDGRGRTDFNGVIRSFGESADYYAQKIQELIEELKVSQPLLPVTEFPKASTIDKAITVVNEDGSTNIKGVYKDKNGLTVIKYNEVENWEEIGFPKGSISRGIKNKTEQGEYVDTGNIKFFAHGLDSAASMINFDAFSLVDSDALLSVSYAERPESKYRFFRPQGVILDCDTKYVHGGGKTDAGSGTKKTVQEFKDNYIFGGYREDDRKFISNLIKEATGMDDLDYIYFIKENENKSFNEIEPVEIREKIIKAFSGINSNKRIGNRAYNEMYISNPKPPMAVFAYNMKDGEKIGNPIEFLSRTSISRAEKGQSVFERTEFLQEYALERDIPFIVFGD